MGIMSEDLENRKKACEEVQTAINDNVGKIDVSGLQGCSDQLSAAWQTDGGQATLTELNDIIASIQEDTDALNKAVEELKNAKVEVSYRWEESRDFKLDNYMNG